MFYVLEEGAYEDRTPVAVYASLVEAQEAAAIGPRGGRKRIAWSDARVDDMWYGRCRYNEWRITAVPLFA